MLSPQWLERDDRAFRSYGRKRCFRPSQCLFSSISTLKIESSNCFKDFPPGSEDGVLDMFHRFTVSPLLEIGRLGLSERGRMEANRLMGSLETQKQTGRMFSQDALKNQKDADINDEKV